MADLLSYPALVETPYITVEIAGVTFGLYQKRGNAITFPNFVKSLNIVKINGQLNTYSLKLTYQIQAGEDPNYMDAIFSKNKSMYGYQKIILNYGDMSSPSFIFKKEEAIATKIKVNTDFSSSRIDYTLDCTSTKLQLLSNSFSFPPVEAKPSDVMINLICNKKYGIQDVLPGMSSKSLIRSLGLIASDDKKVKIEGKENVDILYYLNYLTECMSPVNDPVDTIKKSAIYKLTIEDDYDGKVGGAYLKVTKVEKNRSTLNNDSPDVYSVDIGYPGNNFVSGFTVNYNDEWSIYYDYSMNLNQNNYVRTINNKGELESIFSPALTTSRKYKYTTESDKSWWTAMTEFPVTATLTIKGLLKPAILMDKIRINTYFYGLKHVSSGLYIITKQEDSVTESGYKTTLSLTRVSADTLK